MKFIVRPKIHKTQLLFRGCDQSIDLTTSAKDDCRASLSKLSNEITQRQRAIIIATQKTAVDMLPRRKPVTVGLATSIINWEDRIALADLGAIEQLALKKYFHNEFFKKGTIQSDQLLLKSYPMIENAIKESNIEIPKSISFLVPSKSFGAYGFVPGHVNYSSIFRGPIVINPDITSENSSQELDGTLLNEFSHVLTNKFLVKYIQKQRREGINGHAKEIVLSAFAEFSSEEVPEGNYSFSNYDELISECFNYSIYPRQIVDMYASYGSGETPTYKLSEDFLAMHISNYLLMADPEHYAGTNLAEIKQVFSRLYMLRNDANAAYEILNKYRLLDYELHEYLQSKYADVGKQLYDFLSASIEA